MKMPWEQDKEWNNTVVSNVPENSWGVIVTENGLNYMIEKDQRTVIADLINRVTSLEDTVELILERLQINTAENTNDDTFTIIKDAGKPRW